MAGGGGDPDSVSGNATDPLLPANTTSACKSNHPSLRLTNG